MGTSCFRTNVVPEYRISPDKLRTLIDSSKNKCKEERAKKIEAINKIKSEIVKFIKENDMKSANTKTDILIKDENYVAVYNILDPILEHVKEKCNNIVSDTECPEDLRNYLDSILYATIRLDIDELMIFKDKINKIYGSDYVEIAVNNKDKKVNKDLVEKLKITTFSEEIIKERQNQLLSEDQALVQQPNNSIAKNSTSKGILKNFNNNNQSPSTNINSKSTIKGNIIDESPDDEGISTKNKKEKIVMFNQTLLDTIHIQKKSQLSKSNFNNNSNIDSSHNDNKISEGELKAVELFPTKTNKTILVSDNQSNQQPQDDNDNENVNNSLFGKTKKTFFNNNNQSNEQPKENGNIDKELLRAETYKTLNESIANPDYKENPYEGKADDILGKTIQKEEVIINPKENDDIFDPNAKLQDPFGGKTIIVKEESTKQKDVKPQGKNDEK